MQRNCRLATPCGLIDGNVYLRNPLVKVGDDMPLHVDAGRERRVLCGYVGDRSAAFPDVRGDKLGIDARRIDDREPGDEHNERETPDPCG